MGNLLQCCGIFFSRCCITFLFLALPILADPVKRFDKALHGLISSNLSIVDKSFLKQGLKSGNDQLLALYELGSFYQMTGNFKKSTEFFNLADAVAHDYESKALISASGVGRYSGAVLMNDSVMRYEGLFMTKSCLTPSMRLIIFF